MAMNYEFERHIQAAREGNDFVAATQLRNLQTMFNGLKDAGLVKELPLESEISQPESVEQGKENSESVGRKKRDTDGVILSGNLLREARLSKRISQISFSSLLGRSQSLVSEAERPNNIRKLNLNTVASMCLLLEVDILQLAPDTEDATVEAIRAIVKVKQREME